MFATKTSRRAFGLGTLAALAAPCIARAASAEPIRIGWMQALTGPSSAAGIGFHNGSTYAVNKHNAAGGRPIELIVRDTQGDPTKAVNAAQELIARSRVVAILGPGNSGESLATTPIIARAGVPHMHGGTLDALIDPVKFPNAFRSGASNTEWSQASTHYVTDILKARKVAVFGDNTGYGMAAVQSSVTDLEQHGCTIAVQSLVDPNQVDVSADMQRARQAGATAILAWTASTGLLARLLNTRDQLNWDLPVTGHPTLGSGEVGRLLARPQNWEKVYPISFRNCSFDAAGKLPPRQEEFMRSLPSSIDMSTSLMWLVSWGYDAVNLIASAVAKAGADDHASIIAALNTTTNYPGIMGTYSFSPTNHNGFPAEEVVMVQANSFRNGSFMLAPGY
jgi:branched-chain amino acid transport system substrate-binding protein